MDNYDKIIFVMENRGWKNGKLIEFIKRSKYKMDELLVDKSCLDKLSIPLDKPVKPACETLQKRFDIYVNAINQIDDFFEYRYERLDKNQIKEIVMNIIDGITLKLRLSKSV